jgi:hypothetical protein
MLQRAGKMRQGKPRPVLGNFNGGLSDPPLEKQIPRARKKALGMTKLKIEEQVPLERLHAYAFNLIIQLFLNIFTTADSLYSIDNLHENAM